MQKTKSIFHGLSRAVFFMMVCSMIAGIVQVNAYAYEVHPEEGDFTFVAYYDTEGYPPGSITITGYEGTGKEIILPVKVTIDGNEYTASEEEGFYVGDNAFKKNNIVTKIAAPNGIERIHTSAFQECKNLIEIAVDNSLEYIGQDAFADCENLKTYRISGTNIGKRDAWEKLYPETTTDPKIGQKSDGTVYPNVTVYTVEGSPIDEYIKAVNKRSQEAGGYQITLKYESDPYSNHTVKPESTTPTQTPDSGTTTPSGGGNDGTTSPSDGGNGGTTTPSTSGNGGTTTPSTGGNSGTGTPSASTTTPASGGNTGTPAAGTTAATDRTKVNGQDGTPLGKGAAAEAAEAYLKGYTSENDPKGTSFGLLQMKSSGVKANSFKLSWKKQTGAKSYVLYGNKCGKNNKYVRQMVTKKTSATIKKVNKKKLSKGTYYKFIVVALDAKGNVLATSKTVHTATSGGKAGNDKSVKTKAKKNKVSVKVKKTFKLGAKEVPASKKLKVSRHRKVAYESSNPKIAKVSSKGVITGVKKGSCYVYAYAQNGAFAKIKVTVK